MSDPIRVEDDGTRTRTGYYLATDQHWFGQAPTLNDEHLRIGRDVVRDDGTIDPHGGCRWEFMVNRVDLSQPAAEMFPGFTLPAREHKFLRVEVFDEAWVAYAEIPEFFAHLATVGDTADLASLAAWCAEQGWLDTADRTGGADR